MLHCGKEKIFSEGHSTFAAQQYQAVSFNGFYYIVVRSEELKPEKSDFLSWFSLVSKIGRRVSV